MNTTNPKKLRAELKDYLDLAGNEPIRIQRRSGESFILIAEDQYAEMQNEILALQRRLLGMSQAVEGQGKEYIINNNGRAKRFSKKASSE